MCFLYTVHDTGLCRQLTTYFSKAKTAAVFGLLILFGSVFPYIGVAPSSILQYQKVRYGACT